jgi:hypothetical protein
LRAKIDALLAEMNTGGWDIGFVHEPANSPDCNTLDLAFFRAIQSFQYQKCPKNIDELIAHVMNHSRSVLWTFVARFGQLPKLSCIKLSYTTATTATSSHKLESQKLRRLLAATF